MSDAPSWLRAARRDAPENAAALLAILSSAWLSRRLGYPAQQVSLFWLPTSLSLAWLLRRGRTALPGLAGGFVAWAVASPTFPMSLGLAAGSVCGSLCAASILSAWYRRRPTASTVQQVARLLLAALLIQAPVAALLALSVHQHYASALPQPARFVGAVMLIEGMSAVLFAPALMALLPARAGHASCPLPSFVDTPGGDPRRIEATSIAAIVAVTALCVLPPLLFTTGLQMETSLMLTLSLSLLAVAAMHGSAATAGTVAMVAGIGVLAMHARSVPYPTSAQGRYEAFQTLLWIAQGAALYYLVLATSLERRRQAMQLERDATTDPVTGLANLRAFEQALADRAAQARGVPVLVGEVAVDRYDEIELLAGRAAARRLSRLLGERLRDSIGASGCVASLADDRFVLCLPQARAGLPDASALAARLHARLDSQWLQVEGRRLLVRTGVGVLLIPADEPVALEPLLGALATTVRRALADPQRHVASELADALFDERRTQLQDIESVRQAMHERRVELHAQPIVSAHAAPDGTLHYEVLARVRAPDGSLLLPGQFLPALAQGGLLREFDRLVLALAIEHLAADAALRGATGLCALNMTGTTLSDAGFAEHVERELARGKLPATMLGVEVTESDSIVDFDAAQSNLRRLAKLGVSIAIDDFGTGLATFDYAKRLSAQWLKIDGSFVRRLAEDALDREIVRSIVRVAHLTGARTAAECVETPELAAQLARLGVDALQGWGIARPMPIGEIAAWRWRPGGIGPQESPMA